MRAVVLKHARRRRWMQGTRLEGFENETPVGPPPRPVVVLALLSILAIACESPDAPSPPSVAGPIALERSAGAGSVEIEPMCQLGCTDPDPNPASPGIFLGSAISPEFCADTESSGDADQDGLVDYCEERAAEAFAPDIFWAQSNDDVRREPYWAARFVESDLVRVAYLPAYYRDLGSSVGACTVPFAHLICEPHNGDSEAIAVDLRYNYLTQHWVLERAHLSQHGSFVQVAPGASGYPSMTYPTGAGDYPKVWVAEDKHANYRSASSCNSGGTFNSDTCVRNNRADRLEAYAIYNVGSRNVAFFDCVASRNTQYEYYGQGRTECFWTSKPFRGWVPDHIGGRQATGYSSVLTQLGF